MPEAETGAETGACPLCLGRRLVRGRHGGRQCPACQLAWLDDTAAEAALPARFLDHFRAAEIPVGNPAGWRARLGLDRPAACAIEGFLVEPATAIRLVECAGGHLTGIRRPAWLRLHHASRIGFECRMAEVDTGLLENLTIGGICRPQDGAAIADLIAACLPISRHFAFVVDSNTKADATAFKANLMKDRRFGDISLAVAARALNRQFGAQRSRLQALSATPWMLQLDTDERPSPRLKAGLRLAMQHADLAGYDSIGFARANYVDGKLSALWPDIQFRLNRRTVVYRGDVHESPDLPWWRQSWSLMGHILHDLSSERLPRRAATYEGISKGGGRPHDTALLETPFPPLYADDPLLDIRPTPTL